MRLLHIVFSILLFFSFLFPQNETDSPKYIVEQYLDLTLKKHDFKNAYFLLSNADKNIKTSKDFQQENTNKYSNKIPKQMENISEKIDEAIRENTNWQILGTSYTDSSSIVKVMLSTTDYEKIVLDLFQELLPNPGLLGDSKFDDEPPSLDDFQNQFLEKINSVGFIEEEKEYILIKEMDGWRLFIDFKKLDKVKILLDEAIEEMKILDYENAISKFHQVLEIDSHNSLAKKTIDYLVEVQKFQEFVNEISEYIKRGELELAMEKLNQLSEMQFTNQMVRTTVKSILPSLKNSIIMMKKNLDHKK